MKCIITSLTHRSRASSHLTAPLRRLPEPHFFTVATVSMAAAAITASISARWALYTNQKEEEKEQKLVPKRPDNISQLWLKHKSWAFINAKLTEHWADSLWCNTVIIYQLPSRGHQSHVLGKSRFYQQFLASEHTHTSIKVDELWTYVSTLIKSLNALQSSNMINVNVPGMSFLNLLPPLLSFSSTTYFLFVCLTHALKTAR